ncbi:MAG: peptide chain release factor N(5)-glutamine methyltransferase [Clostridia bacterium]|nr:peptide chain release factor N(5)-glutamine methyltransferase [Clostridia bacterium]
MTVGEALKQASTILKRNNIEDPSFEAGLLLSWLLKKDTGYLYSHDDESLDAEACEAFLEAVGRRADHEPFAYITGECEFLSLPFEVNPSVLIPRGDTELLAECALYAMGHETQWFRGPSFKLNPEGQYRVLEVGTGSGCLAVSMAKYVPTCRVDALDISEQALETAQRNAAKNGVADRISFHKIDFLAETLPSLHPYHLLISNPPYIPDSDIPGLMPSVRDYEPYSALAGGEDGLMFYRALSQKAESLLIPSGIIAVECGIHQACSIQRLFAEKNMKTQIFKDLSGIERVVAAQKV